MVSIFEKIKEKQKPIFSMPLSLRLIKECSQNNIEWKYLHIADLFSILYSVRIDYAQNYLKNKKQKMLSDKGIQSVTQATEEDFDKL